MLWSETLRGEIRHIFTGPSLYFHRRTIERLRDHQSPAEAIQHDDFVESLYATLTSWGMHRMGPKGAKLKDYQSFKAGFEQHQHEIRDLESTKLIQIKHNELEEITTRLWKIVSGLQVSTTLTQIVAGSKALHHVLPELVPPIDREYTIPFFYGYKRAYPGHNEFIKVFSNFHAIAQRCGAQIEQLIGANTGADRMNTSTTKVIDNAILGYALAHKTR